MSKLAGPQVLNGQIIYDGEVLGQPIASYAESLSGAGTKVIDVLGSHPTAKWCEIVVAGDPRNICAISRDSSTPGLPIGPGGITDTGDGSLVFVLGGQTATIPVKGVRELTFQTTVSTFVGWSFWS